MAKKVALMVGHGKMTNGVWDCGCAYAGNTEAALMLPITKSAVKYLRQSGITVISDADTNNNRNMVVDVAWANREKVDVYISVHCDWYKAPTGVYPLYVSSRGKKVADALNTAIKAGIPMKSRGVCKRTDLYELNATDAPACILETGSIKADIKTLKNYDKYGKCIAKGICNYLGVKFKELAEPVAKAPEPTLYRVRKTWADAKSQIGAYKDIANAKKIADEKGLSVFDNNGKVVYTGKKKVEVSAPKTTTPKTTAPKVTTPKATTPAKNAQIKDKAKSYALASKEQAEYKKDKPKDNFKKDAQKIYGSKINLSDCQVFAGTVITGVGYPKMPVNTWSNIFKYLNKHFTSIKVNYTESQLKEGDIRVYQNDKGGYHIWIITGTGQKCEGNHNRYYPHFATNKPATKHKNDWLFRAK